MAGEAAAPDVKRQFEHAWRNGKIVILGMLAEGPDAGGEVVCITPRRDFLRHIRKIQRKASDPHWRYSLQSAIRSEVVRGIARLTPQTDRDFMDDLALMMAAKIAHGEAMLDGSGLFSLHIALDDDESKPWFQRGFLEPMDATVS